MNWEKILKRRAGGLGPSPRDIRLINYILRDGEFKTVARILDEIYDLLQENKKLGINKTSRMQGRPKATKFGAAKRELKIYMTSSPDYEFRDSGNRDRHRQPIKEYRYIGE